MVASKECRRRPLDAVEIESAAMFGLALSARDYERVGQDRFDSYATVAVRNAIRRYYRDKKKGVRLVQVEDFERVASPTPSPEMAIEIKRLEVMAEIAAPGPDVQPDREGVACRACSTTGGYVQKKRKSPVRVNGLCLRCYNREFMRAKRKRIKEQE